MRVKGFYLPAVAGCVLCVLCFGCVRKSDAPKVLVEINDYKMTVDDFKEEVRYSPYDGDESLDVDNFMDFVIKKYVLIQEAQKQGLDRHETFMRTIERYWRQTLIKELIEKETQKAYRDVVKGGANENLNKWVEQLYSKSDIRIHNDVLDEVKGELR